MELRSFAAKNSPTVESTVKQSSPRACARGTVARLALAIFSRRTGWEHDPENARCAFNFLERVGRRWTFFRECINVFPVSVEQNALMPALSHASRHVSAHPAKANHSNLHIYFAKVVLVEEPKNCEGAVRYPQWNMQRLLFAWCSFAQMGPTPPRTLRKISAAASMPNGGAVK